MGFDEDEAEGVTVRDCISQRKKKRKKKGAAADVKKWKGGGGGLKEIREKME